MWKNPIFWKRIFINSYSSIREINCIIKTLWWKWNDIAKKKTINEINCSHIISVNTSISFHFNWVRINGIVEAWDVQLKSLIVLCKYLTINLLNLVLFVLFHVLFLCHVNVPVCNQHKVRITVNTILSKWNWQKYAKKISMNCVYKQPCCQTNLYLLFVKTQRTLYFLYLISLRLSFWIFFFVFIILFWLRFCGLCLICL